MLIEFSVSNFCSFNKLQTLSFRATALDSPCKEVDDRNIVDGEPGRLLKILGIYGPNAGGKSNLLKALSFYKEMISVSVAVEGISKLGINPFRHAVASSENPSFFQGIFDLFGRKLRYGFTLNYSGKIEQEWLFGPAEKNETWYFKRNGENVLINKEWFVEGLNLPEDNLRDDALFLTFCSSYNGGLSKEIRNYFNREVSIDGKLSRRPARIIPGSGSNSTSSMLINGHHEVVLTWLREVGLNYSDIQLRRRESELRDILSSSFEVWLSKNIYDESGKVVGKTEMNLRQDESEGTQKFFNYIGKLYRKFQEGGLYVCDEIDSNFHPSLLQKIIQLFQNPTINVAGAQLLFTSHDTNLMNPEIMRRDQFYFVEKDLQEASRLYSLADLKGIRNNADFARQYLAGVYGALPVLGNYLEEQGLGEELK